MHKYILSGINGNVGSILRKKICYSSEYNQDIKSSDADIFIHLASKSSDNYEDIVTSNITYLIQCIEFCKKNHIKKFVFFSAISIYTNDSVYSISKLLGEKILKESELNVLVMRLPMILTDDNKNGILNRIIMKLRNNEDIIIYNANKKFNNFISVHDIANFITNYKFDKKYEIIDLASKKEYTLLEIVKFLKKEIKAKSNIIVSKQTHPFVNISIKNAIKEYGYKPKSTKKILKLWLEGKMKK